MRECGLRVAQWVIVVCGCMRGFVQVHLMQGCVCAWGGGVRVCAALLNITATVALMHTLYHLYHSDNSHTMVDQQKIKTWHIDVACAQSFATPRISC